MKIFKKILIFLLIAIIITLTIFFIIGYSTYTSALKDEPLITKIDKITTSQNFTKFDEMSEDYRNAVIAVEDHRFYDHGALDFISIARALAIKPVLLLCDEPTGNLDSRTSQDVIGLLKASSMKLDQTIIMITHNEEIAQMADRTIRIEDGKIVTRKWGEPCL